MFHPVARALWVTGLFLPGLVAAAVRPPVVIGTVATTVDDRPVDLAVAGHRAWVLVDGDDTPALVSVDVATPAAPRVLGRTPLPFPARRLVARAGRAYLATADPARELAIMDVAGTPRVLATLDLPGTVEATAIALADTDVERKHVPVVYVGTRRHQGAELHTVLVADPAAPRALAAVEIGADVRDLRVRDDAVYAATGDPARALVVLDGPGPTALAERGVRALPGDGATGVEVERGRVWVTTPNRDGAPDLHLLDDDGAAGTPALRASIDLGSDDGRVTAQGMRAFVAARTARHALTIVRAGDETIRLVDTLAGAAPAVAVALGAQHVFVAGVAGTPLLQVVDPGTPLAAVADGNGDGLITVVCLGDSNTMFDHVGDLRRSWCELLDDAVANPNWRFVNRALLGMTAVDLGRTIGDIPAWVDAPTGEHTTIDASLREDRADVAILSFGTNDLRALTGRTATPEQLVAAYVAHKAKLERGGVGLVLIALTPPTFPPSDPADRPRIDTANDLLRAALPADALLDFATGMVPADYGYRDAHDGVHIGPSGQQKRMRTAYRRLVPDA